MEYAVIYESQTGNTRRVAEAIFKSLHSDHKQLYNLERVQNVKADVYFVGFGVRNNGCSMKVIDCLEQINDGRIALFGTCGYPATEQYRGKVAKMMDIWLPTEAEYLGLFLCQGRIPDYQQEKWRQNSEIYRPQMEELFQMADSHPDRDDIAAACAFAEQIQRKVEPAAAKD